MSAPLAALWAAWVAWWVVGRPPPARPLTRRVARRAGTRPGAAVAGAAAVVAAAVVLGPLAAALLVIAGTVGALARRRSRRRAAARRAAACVPDLGELLRIAVAGGLTPALALAQVAEFGPQPGRAAVAEALAATRRGRPLGDALTGLVSRLGPEARPLVDALAATDRYGVPLEPVLDAAVADLRRQRRTAAQEAARRLPVTLSFPLVGCVLPAFALLSLAPLVAGAVASLQVPSPAPRLGPAGPAPVPDPGGASRARRPAVHPLPARPGPRSQPLATARAGHAPLDAPRYPGRA